MRHSLLSLLAALVLPTAVLQAQTAAQWMSRLQAKYERIQTLSAEFEQIFVSRGLRLQESGRVLLKKPGKMLWEYRQPRKKLFVSDGERSYFYLPDDRQVMVSDLNWEESRIPLLFLLGRGNLSRDFETEMATEEGAAQPNGILLLLRPRERQPEFDRILMEIDSEDVLIHRLIVVEPLGNRNEYILRNVRLNPAISDARFHFTIPQGIEVFQQ